MRKRLVEKTKKRFWRFEAESYTEWWGNQYHTTVKVYDRKIANDRKVMNWFRQSGLSHWDNPCLVFSSTVEGTSIGYEAAEVVKALHAEWIEE